MNLRLIFILGLFFYFVSSVSAAGIVGVSPGNVRFQEVLRGGYAERPVTITVDSDQIVTASFEARGEITDWLNFSDSLNITRGSPGRLFLSVSPPSDVPNGNYSGFVRISTEAVGGPGREGHATGVIRAVIDLAITVEVTDFEVMECVARNFGVQTVEKGEDIKFNLDVLNRGNIRLRPQVVVEIWDQEQSVIVKTESFIGREILPTRDATLDFKVSSDDLDLDQYWVDVSVPDCYSSDILTFDVLEPGTLRAEGILRRIFSVVWTSVDETVPIYVEFDNTGEKDVDSRFRGQITREGSIVQVLESEIVDAPVGEITNFTFFFTPRKAGRYVASGRIFYDNKRTFESSTIINVKPEDFGVKQFFMVLAYIALTTFIAYMFYKIRKEKRRFSEKIKSYA